MKFKLIQKALLAALTIATPFSSVFAKHLSPQEALARIEQYSGLKHMPGISKLNLAHTEELDGNEMVYIFNSDNGFILVSADDNMPALLGYSENGYFDQKTSSPSLKWWISQYAEEGELISSTIQSSRNSFDSKFHAPSADKEEIPYMIQTLWGQQNPYNLDCPKIGSSRCVTGCIATAMAQIIKYHAYPESGFGENTYEWNDTLLNYNFASAKFEYSDMLDSYRSSSASEDQKKAVANLMYACGVAVDMNYNDNESGATDTYIAYALRHFFKYDNEIKLLKRSFFSASDWEDLIYSELKEKRPVIMGGQARDGGHQFICDGYDGDGFFHINWGWEGLGDGYFLLTALNPDNQGVGGHEGGYNSEQSIICGIKPEVDGSLTWYPVYANNSIGFSGFSNSSINIEFAQGGIFNYSQEEFTVEAFIQAIDENGDTYISDNGVELSFVGANGLNIYGYGGLGTMSLPKNLPAGTYKGHIVIKTPEGNIQKVLFPFTAISYFNIDVDSSGTISCSLGQPEERAEIKVTGFETDGEIIAGEPATIYISVENIGEINYDGTIQLKVCVPDSETVVAMMNFTFGTIESGKSARGYIYPTFTDAGTFDVIFFDQYGDAISDPFTISVADSGVEKIIDINSNADVFSYSGTLLKKNADKEYISNLPKGIYIIKAIDKTIKVIK